MKDGYVVLVRVFFHLPDALVMVSGVGNPGAVAGQGGCGGIIKGDGMVG